jgi:hypothetical protein
MVDRFVPDRTARSFRELDVYQKTLKASVEITEKILPAAAGFPLRDDMIRCCLSIPVLIADAHSRRFEGRNDATVLLEDSMAHCSRIAVYLDQLKNIYGSVDKVLCEDLIRGYENVRIRIFNLMRAWKGEWKK